MVALGDTLLGRGPEPRVKICGITNAADAKLAVDAGADALGFNFYRLSPRYIAPEEAGRIIRRLPRGVVAVGVFVDEPVDSVRRIAGAAGLDAAQLHGRERPASVRQVAAIRPAVRVIKVFRVRRGFSVARLASYPEVAAFLLDGFRSGFWGGTGARFDWEVARRAKRYGRIVLAGGLRPENVAEALERVRPFAIDVSSGVEVRPGKKDPAKLKALMREVERIRRRRR